MLHLDCNQLTALPERCHQWTRLTTLTFADNSVREIPAGAAAWKSLQYINMKSNLISDLPAPIVKAWSLVGPAV